MPLEFPYLDLTLYTIFLTLSTIPQNICMPLHQSLHIAMRNKKNKDVSGRSISSNTPPAPVVSSASVQPTSRFPSLTAQQRRVGGSSPWLGILPGKNKKWSEGKERVKNNKTKLRKGGGIGFGILINNKKRSPKSIIPSTPALHLHGCQIPGCICNVNVNWWKKGKCRKTN